jgi:hypothetical protein
MNRALMPEATVNENCYFYLTENDIWPTPPATGDKVEILSKSIARPMELRSNSQLRLSISSHIGFRDTLSIPRLGIRFGYLLDSILDSNVFD